MHILLDFLRRYNYLFLFILLEAVSIALLLRFSHYQGSAWLSAANDVVATVNSWQQEGKRYLSLANTNELLASDNLQLQRENEALRQALHKATHDTTAIEHQLHTLLSPYDLLPARVVSNHVMRGRDNYIVIDRGTRDGVQPEMGVVASGGVVGIVYLAGPHHALVLPITHSKSSISVRVRQKPYFGYLEWDGLSTRTAHVDDIPRYAKAKVKDVVETSGYSAVFPPGLFVGRIERVGNSSDGQSYRLGVRLGQDLAAVQEVSVVRSAYKTEIDSLRSKADSLQ